MDYDKAVEAHDFIRSRSDREIKIAVVLGSGLGGFAEDLENAISISYEEIPHFSVSTVEGHAGSLVIGEVDGVGVAVQQGRFHYYEGYDIREVVFPMRVFGLLGIKTAIITNAAGSVITSFKQGDLMLIRDHINMMGVSPLRGENNERFGPRFPDMTNIYTIALQEMAKEEAGSLARERHKQGLDKKLKPFLRRGVYCALSGPNYETPAEIRMYRLLGATAVGMSTVPESIVARHQGMNVLGISCITNLAAGITNEEIHHDEVMAMGQLVGDKFNALLRRLVVRIGNL